MLTWDPGFAVIVREVKEEGQKLGRARKTGKAMGTLRCLGWGRRSS